MCVLEVVHEQMGSQDSKSEYESYKREITFQVPPLSLCHVFKQQEKTIVTDLLRVHRIRDTLIIFMKSLNQTFVHHFLDRQIH